MDHRRPTNDEVLDALRTVMDPELHRDVVSLGMIRDLEIREGEVSFKLVLTTPACPMKSQMKEAAERAVRGLPGVSAVGISVGSEVRGRAGPSPEKLLPQVCNVIAIGSGKGGVGKSTVAVNLSVALAQAGAKVGLLDADVYGPNIPQMMGATDEPIVANGKLEPVISHGVRLMSLGFMMDDDTPVIWRGGLVVQAVRQLLRDVNWGELDYLLVDLPPGTGDAPLSLSQLVPLTGAVIVTTPQDVALTNAMKGLSMFRRLAVPILGIVENMSYFVCAHCGEKTEIFSHGGGEEASRRLGVPFLGEVALHPRVRSGGDDGIPVVISDPDSVEALAFTSIAGKLASAISVLQASSTGEGTDRQITQTDRG